MPYPDFEAVRKMRFSEMNAEQRADATELWLRNNLGACKALHGEHVKSLLARLDAERLLLRAYMARVIDVEGVSFAQGCGMSDVRLTDVQQKSLDAIEADVRREYDL